MRPIATLAGRHDPKLADQLRGISRYTLRQLLLEGLDRHVHFDKDFERCQFQDKSGVTASFADGSTAQGDFLVGADDSGSSVVRHLLPGAVARDTGFTALTGKVKSDAEVAALLPPPPFDHIGLVLGPRRLLTFFSEQKPADRYARLAATRPDLAPILDPAMDFSVWSLVAPTADLGWADSAQASGQMVLDAATRLLADSDPRMLRLVAKTLPEDAGPVTSWQSPTSTQWPTHPCWTVLGDAIHSMVPLRGRGASSAMIDADQLRIALCEDTAGSSMTERVGHYERAMRRRGFRQVSSSGSTLALARATGVKRLAFLAGLRLVSGVLKLRPG